jgi:hypothetical protein
MINKQQERSIITAVIEGAIFICFAILTSALFMIIVFAMSKL